MQKKNKHSWSFSVIVWLSAARWGGPVSVLDDYRAGFSIRWWWFPVPIFFFTIFDIFRYTINVAQYNAYVGIFTCLFDYISLAELWSEYCFYMRFFLILCSLQIHGSRIGYSALLLHLLVIEALGIWSTGLHAAGSLLGHIQTCHLFVDAYCMQPGHTFPLDSGYLSACVLVSSPCTVPRGCCSTLSHLLSKNTHRCIQIIIHRYQLSSSNPFVFLKSICVHVHVILLHSNHMCFSKYSKNRIESNRNRNTS